MIPRAALDTHLLETLSAYIALEPAAACAGAALFRPRQYARKSTLLGVGEWWREIYFIHRGALRLFYTSRDGREFNKGFFFDGQLAWPISPVAREAPSLFTIAALEDTQLLSADLGAVEAWLRGLGLWERFALPQTQWLAGQKVMREAEFLLDSAQLRYQRFARKYADYLARIPDYHIASYLGITPVSLSRIKRKSKNLT